MIVGSLPGARAIVERSQRAFGHRALDAALDGLMMQPERPTDRKKRRVFPIGQQYPRPLHPARRFGSRLRDRSQLRCMVEISPGPNNPVGLVWIALSAPSYGIHGTPDPDKVSKTESHGCIRLTNWDALALAKLVRKGTRVEFLD